MEGEFRINTQLTDEQRAVVRHPGGNALVSAVAGSGKTHTMVERIRHLVRNGADPHRVRAVMFNKAAAADFRARLAKVLVGGPVPSAQTFNSMGERMVKTLIQSGHLPAAELETRPYKRERLIKTALITVYQRQNGNEAWPGRELYDEFSTFIDRVKSDVLPAPQMLERLGWGGEARIFPLAFAEFEAARREARLRFYADQVWDPVRVLLANPQLSRRYEGYLDHLCVDESQDLSPVQVHLVRIIARPSCEIMVVGDDDQCIYAWRGADPRFMTHDFAKEFAPVTHYTLSRTFRYGDELAVAANHLIHNNVERIPKLNVSGPDAPPTRIDLVGMNEKDDIADEIEQEHAAGYPLTQIAILVRTYSLAVPLELQMLERGVPYFVYGRESLLQVKEISAMIGVLSIVSGRWLGAMQLDDRVDMLQDVLSTPTLYLAATTLQPLLEQMATDPHRAPQILRRAVTQDTKSSVANRVRERADLLHTLIHDGIGSAPPGAILRAYASMTRLKEEIERQCASQEDADERNANVEAFIKLAEAHKGDVRSFLHSLEPLADERAKSPPQEPHVTITSIHRSKGMEFGWVILPGMARGTFPRDIQDSEIEAERRLAYVGMTRAVERLSLLVPPDTELKKSLDDPSADIETCGEASSFVHEARIGLSRVVALRARSDSANVAAAVPEPDIANRYFEACGSKFRFNAKPAPPKPAAPSIVGYAWSKGERFFHDTWGPGTVVDVFASGLISVRTDKGSSHMVVAKVAPMRPLR